jgi:CMP-N-acetylneuraminic acid synthetase
MSEVLGIIAARGGSKRIPEKNLREVGGKPLLAHAVKDAKKAARIDDAIVSTENAEISEVAVEYGGRAPFERPAELATDTATTNEVVEHALDWFEDRGETFDLVSSIPVTTPFRTPKDIDKAIDQLRSLDASSVVSVTEFDPPPFWAVDHDKEGYLNPYFDDEYLWSTTRSQEVPTLMRPNGAVFAATVEAFREHVSFYTDQTAGYEMPRERSLDIDEPFDLEIARALSRREV